MSHSDFVRVVKQLQGKSGQPIYADLTPENVADLLSVFNGCKDSVKITTNLGHTIEVRLVK